MSDWRALQRIVGRGITELGIEDDFAEAIGNVQDPPWRGSIRSKRIRLFQALNEDMARNFDAAWVLMGVRFFTLLERADLVDEMHGVFMRVRFDAEREREELPERPRTMKVHPDSRRRRAMGG